MTRLQKIVSRMQDRLAEISQDNGFRTDAGKRVVLIDVEADPLRPYEGKQYDCGLVMQIGASEPVDEAGNVALGGVAAADFLTDITIFGFRRMESRSAWFASAQELEADIKQAIFGRLEDRRYYKDTGIGSVRMGSAAAQVPSYGNEFVGVEVPLIIQYVENLSNPWEPETNGS